MADCTPKRVLVNDFDPFVAQVVKVALEERGYEVRIVTSQVEVIREVEEWSPSLFIITSLLLAGDGIRLLEKLGANHISETLRIIVLSGYVSNRIDEYKSAYGIDAAFPKPIEVNALVSKVNELLAE